jgi:glucose/arabinose dehydrogenase
MFYLMINIINFDKIKNKLMSLFGRITNYFGVCEENITQMILWKKIWPGTFFQYYEIKGLKMLKSQYLPVAILNVLLIINCQAQNNNALIVTGWRQTLPKVTEGFKVNVYAAGLKSPAWAYVTPNGDVLVAQSKLKSDKLIKTSPDVATIQPVNYSNDYPNQITLFRDLNNDGFADIREVFLTGIAQPFGMLILNDAFYVAAEDGVWKYSYKTGQTKLESNGTKILELPSGDLHRVKNIITNEEGTKLYVTVCSKDYNSKALDTTGVGSIIEMNPDGSEAKVYHRSDNPVCMDKAPVTRSLWIINHQSDKENGLDYLSEIKNNEEDNSSDIHPYPLLDSQAVFLNLVFYKKNTFPDKYKNGAFIAQQSSSNSSQLTGNKIVFLPFKNGKPVDHSEDFLTGFTVEGQNGSIYGRPAGITVLPDGSMLVMDDASDIIWCISYK